MNPLKIYPCGQMFWDVLFTVCYEFDVIYTTYLFVFYYFVLYCPYCTWIFLLQIQEGSRSVEFKAYL